MVSISDDLNSRLTQYQPSPDIIIFFRMQLQQWFKVNGRTHLPWKPQDCFDEQTNLYRIWVSEIMLQQTQVATVLPYFERFMTAFPTLTALAEAAIDDVLRLWAGLGYYARGRNLHATACTLINVHHGIWPRDLDQLMALKGIGRTTASAILAQGFNLPFAIVDGNVKRVLARFLGVDVPAAQLEKVLIPIAQQLMCPQQSADYTQAIMDFGALLCTRQPQCLLCPLQSKCIAFQSYKVDALPRKKIKSVLPKIERFFFFIINSQGELYLLKRPNKGIWGGLWSVFEIDCDNQSIPILTILKKSNTNQAALTKLNKIMQKSSINVLKLDSVRLFTTHQHQFTHYTLTLHCFVIMVTEIKCSFEHALVTLQRINQFGLPQPIMKIAYEILSKINLNNELYENRSIERAILHVKDL